MRTCLQQRSGIALPPHTKGHCPCPCALGAGAPPKSTARARAAVAGPDLELCGWRQYRLPSLVLPQQYNLTLQVQYHRVERVALSPEAPGCGAARAGQCQQLGDFSAVPI